MVTLPNVEDFRVFVWSIFPVLMRYSGKPTENPPLGKVTMVKSPRRVLSGQGTMVKTVPGSKTLGKKIRTHGKSHQGSRTCMCNGRGTPGNRRLNLGNFWTLLRYLYHTTHPTFTKHASTTMCRLVHVRSKIPIHQPSRYNTRVATRSLTTKSKKFVHH